MIKLSLLLYPPKFLWLMYFHGTLDTAILQTEFILFLQTSVISAEGCGVTKGCFREPEGCTGGADCTFYASWTLDEDKNNVFVLSGKAAGYVALGFSKSGGMVSDIFRKYLDHYIPLPIQF